MFRPQSDKTAHASAEKVALLSASSFCGDRAFGRLRNNVGDLIATHPARQAIVRPNGLRRGGLKSNTQHILFG